MSFLAASRSHGGPGRWTAELAEGWDIFGSTNGGYLMAIATRAMEAEAEGRTLISATGTYLNPATAGPVAVDVVVGKRGRNLSTLRAMVSREGKDLVLVTAVFAATGASSQKDGLVLGAPPELPPIDECLSLQPSAEAPLPPPFSGKVDVRLHPDDAALMTGHHPERPLMRGWFRLKDGEELDAHGVVLASDAFAPAVFNSELTLGWTPTVELTVQVRNPSPTGWLACSFGTRFVTGGMFEEDGEIWDEAGNLVALSRQLALVAR
jgi:acyl-CoA thioesterase